MTQLLVRPERRSTALFPSFLAAGFECSTPINYDRARVDELTSTGHDTCVPTDYRLLRRLGIRTARDGVRWNLVDKRGKLDFSSALPFIDSAEAEGIAVIWDLFHYGYPEDLNPFDAHFVERFAAYCYAFARLLVEREHGESNPDSSGWRFYTPVNEISFFAWAGGEVGMFAPFQIGRGPELKRRLAETAIAGMNAIRAADARARFVNCDPLVRVVAPLDAPWLQHEADYFNAHYVCEAWDMLAGRVCPELGGSTQHLDILGVNYYGVNQWEHQKHESVLADGDPRRAPFSAMLVELYGRYRRPIFVAETASTGDHRAQWLRQMAAECERAMEAGVDLHGVCLYPALGMTDWHTGEYRSMGLWESDSSGRRDPYLPLLAEVRAIQKRHDLRWKDAEKLADGIAVVG